jgi:hypothetical protein
VLEEWIGQRWHTELTARTDADGRLAFRGFPGWYEIRENGQTRLVRLGRDQPDGILKR